MNGVESFEPDLLSVINERQQVAYSDLVEYANSVRIDEETLKKALQELKSINAIASRSNGGIQTYYILQESSELRKIVIVEDDKNINKLMGLSVGRGFELTQLFEGTGAVERIKSIRPDLVILDLMLPGMNGLDICQGVKRDPELANTTVIIVSAMDATSNRFKGIQNGADYYIKKPFEPEELRTLVTIFLKKKGKKFDPLIDLPNEDKISVALEKSLQSGMEYEIGRLKVEGFAEFANQFGSKSGITILRLISQLMQDKVKELGNDVFVGFLNSDDFIIAGKKEKVQKTVETLKEDFIAVLPFIYQNAGFKPIELGIDDIYGAQHSIMGLAYMPIQKSTLMARRAVILKNRQTESTMKDGKSIGSYTYEELRNMLGSDNLDIIITRDSSGVKLSVGKGSKHEQKEQ